MLRALLKRYAVDRDRAALVCQSGVPRRAASRVHAGFVPGVRDEAHQRNADMGPKKGEAGPPGCLVLAATQARMAERTGAMSGVHSSEDWRRAVFSPHAVQCPGRGENGLEMVKAYGFSKRLMGRIHIRFFEYSAR